MWGRCRTQAGGGSPLSSVWQPWVACILLIAEDWPAQSHKMCPVSYLHRGVMETNNEQWYCLQSIYNIEREQRQIFSPPSSGNFLSRLTSALDMEKVMGSMLCDLCIHFCSNVQFAHSVTKQGSSSLVLPLWFPFTVCFFPPLCTWTKW